MLKRLNTPMGGQCCFRGDGTFTRWGFAEGNMSLGVDFESF